MTTRPPISMLSLDATTGELPLVSADPTAAAGPILSLIRQSASPAASDLVGYIKFDGMDAAAARQNYASILAQITDATAGSEDGALFFSTCVASVDTVTMTLLGGRVGIGNSAPQAKLHVGAATEAPVTSTPSLYVAENGSATMTLRDATSNTQLDFNVAGGNGTQTLTGPDGAKQFFEVNSQNAFFIYDSLSPGAGAGLVIGAADYGFSDPQQIGAQFHSNPYSVGTGQAGTMVITSGSTGVPIVMNRAAGDGQLMAFFSAGVNAATITVSGGVVTYGTFCGSHWSQLADNSRTEFLRGTIMDTIDEMCEWEGEERNDQLAKFKVSDTPGSKRVYGVWHSWDSNQDVRNAWGGDRHPLAENDGYIAALGAHPVRIAAGVDVHGGDWIESNGDGCGRVQADDIFRSSTVAKVTAAVIIETYPDGSYLVPCTLHCG